MLGSASAMPASGQAFILGATVSEEKRVFPQAGGVPGAIIRPPVLEQTGVRFFDEGEYAGFTIGNSTLRMSYADALRFSQMLRVHAKKAKRRAGDVSRHWSALATLEDLPK
jgi:hypothetical protein